MGQKSIMLYTELGRKLGLPEEALRDVVKYFSHPLFVGAMCSSFGNMLATYLPRIDYKAPPSPRIVSLGCGQFYEAPALMEHFGINGNAEDNVIGIEILEGIAEFTRKTMPPDKRYKIVWGDARNLRSLVNVKFDVVVARNANVDMAIPSWFKIFREARAAMKPEGLLIATSENDLEQIELEEMLKEVGFKIQLADQNKYCLPLTEDIGMDWGVILARA